MEMKLPWSYTALTAFETCPKRYYLTRVAKTVADPMGEAAKWGDWVHKQLQAYAESRTPLPPTLTKLAPLVDKVTGQNGTLVVERKMAITERLTETTWFGKDAWCRGIVDLGVIGTRHAFLLDWKTGARKPDNPQLALFAALAMAIHGDLQEVTTAYVWLKDGKLDPKVFTRQQLVDIWRDFLPRVERMRAAFEENKWPERPSGLCRNYCPVGKQNCLHCGK